MPKLRPGQVPNLRRHRPSGRAVVTLSGRDHYLSPWPDGSTTPELGNYRHSLRPLRRLYESLPAADFSSLKLKAVRQAMIDAGL